TVSVENDLISQIRPDMVLNEAYRMINSSIISFMKRKLVRTVAVFREQLEHLDSLIEDSGIPTGTRAMGNVMMD
ncbi:MAG: hypothetical protein GX137_05080, partial [Thermoplasmatales archaeon]|nr:hypothetical protein [Thermoplasmatales archaeon]